MTSGVTSQTGYVACPTEWAGADNDIRYAYRRMGTGTGRPLVLLQHFRGNLDNWDPALIDLLAAERDVIVFDNTGVGATSGRTPGTVTQMAHDAISFLDALGVAEADVLGFSIGSFAAQELALIRPALVRRLVLASAAPQGDEGMHGWAGHIIDAVGSPKTCPEGFLHAFFRDSPASHQAGVAFLQRTNARTEGRDTATSWQTRNAQYDAVVTWGIPDHSLLQRVHAITVPVLVANGDDDQMIPPRYSHLLAGLLPDARIRLYPDAAHGFLFQHHTEFARDVLAFLSRAPSCHS
jgi:pimeloyl-ACP methyl ester carboxylesterase